MKASTGSLSAVALFLALGGLSSRNQGARQAQSPKYPEPVASRFLVSCPRRIKKGRQGVSKIEVDVIEKQERRPSSTSDVEPITLLSCLFLVLWWEQSRDWGNLY